MGGHLFYWNQPSPNILRLDLLMNMNFVTFSIFFWYALTICLRSFAEQTTFFLLKQVLKTEKNIQNLTSHNVLSCLGKCTDKYSAIKYNPSTTKCRLFAHVLLKWPIEVTVDIDEKTYVKVS